MPFKDTLITEECIKEVTNENLQKRRRKFNYYTLHNWHKKTDPVSTSSSFLHTSVL